MLELVPTERSARVAPAPAIGREWFGKARDFRRRVDREDEAFINTMRALVMPAQLRLVRYPTRKLRPEMLAALVQGWRYAEARDFRTHIEAKLERTRCRILERRAAAGQMKRLDANWEGDEPDISIIELTLTADGNRLRSHSRVVCTFSLHALARRIQRGRDSSDAALLFDMELLARVDADALAPGGYKVTTDEHGGGWRGRVVRAVDEEGEVHRVLSVRTWLAN